MTAEEIAGLTGGKVEVAADGAEASSVYASDLLSDVMGHAGEGAALVTIQNHLNTIAVCTLVGVEVLVICHNRPIPDDMRAAAGREGVAIVTTPLCQYAASLALAALPPGVRGNAYP